jgi:hypothetical protein
MREMYCSYASLRILYSDRGDCERNKRKLQWVCCRLYPFICWIIKKEGPRNFYGGYSPHWVNHAYLCLCCIVYLLCFIFEFYFILLLWDPIFITTGIRANDNSQENRVPISSGRSGRRWEF